MAMLAIQKICSMHSIVYIAQFCEQYWNDLVCRCSQSVVTVMARVTVTVSDWQPR